MTSLAILRHTDSWAGWPVAVLLGLLPRRRRALPAAPRQIVVVKLFGMGSILSCAGVFRALRAAQPGARITLVTFAAAAPVAQMLAPFDDVLAIAGDGLAGIAASGLRALRELRRRQVDVVVDIEYFSKLSSVFCALSGARYRLGFRLPARWRQRLLDGGIAFREDLHFSACVARLLHRLGVDYRNLPAEGIRVPKAAGHAAEALLATDVPAGVCAWIAVNPHANELCVQRRWPLERFADVIAGLLKSRPDLGALVPGMQAERPVAERLRDLVDPAFRPRVRVIAGETALPTLAALLRRVRLTLTNDSGIMHLAAAAGSPLVALFGPESPVRYGPSGASHGIRVLSGDVPCGPCLSYMNHKRAPCGDAPAACMLQIQAGEVRRACEELLENGHGVA